VANLVRNYSPHLAPNTRSAPPTAELRRVLEISAKEMLAKFLKKWRKKREVDANANSKPLGVDKVYHVPCSIVWGLIGHLYRW